MIRRSKFGTEGLLISSVMIFSAIFPIHWTKASAPPQAPVVAPHASITGDVYVTTTGKDTGDGSQQHPWATITHASQMIGPGATVHVAPGKYDEPVITKISGTASARIKYISDKRWGALIEPTKRTVFAWNDTGDYTDVIGFEFASDDCYSIVLGASYQRAMGNNVHNAAENCNDKTRGAGAGIVTGSSDYTGGYDSIIGNYVHDVGIGDPLCGQVGHRSVQGIYVANRFSIVHDNVAAYNCGFGIHLWHAASHIVITNNTAVYNRAGGIVVGAGDAPCKTGGCPEGDDYTIVRNNIVAHNGNPALKGWGIAEEGMTGPHNQYSHNLSYGNLSGDYGLANHLTCAECIVGKDPEFVAADPRDFRVRTSSPAVGRGTARDVPAIEVSNHQFVAGSRQPTASADIGASEGVTHPK